MALNEHLKDLQLIADILCTEMRLNPRGSVYISGLDGDGMRVTIEATQETPALAVYEISIMDPTVEILDPRSSRGRASLRNATFTAQPPGDTIVMTDVKEDRFVVGRNLRTTIDHLKSSSEKLIPA